MMQEKKCVFGLRENIASAVAYAGMLVTGLLTLALERENRTVRFHALQSTLFFGGIVLLEMLIGLVTGVLSWIPLLGAVVAGVLDFAFGLVGALSVVLWVYMMYTAYKGRMVKLPFLGEICWAQVNK